MTLSIMNTAGRTTMARTAVLLSSSVGSVKVFFINVPMLWPKEVH
jgi:hypothetical protein